MLYLFLYPLAGKFTLFNVLRYPSFRIVAAGLTAMVLGLLLGPYFIERMRVLQYGASNVREDTPEQQATAEQRARRWAIYNQLQDLFRPDVPATELAFAGKMKEEYDSQADSMYSTARLWDDGVIDPARTRDVLSLALDAATLHARPKGKFGIFRM